MTETKTVTAGERTQNIGEEISREEARKLVRASGQFSEPYRGYGLELKDGRFVFCAKPNGKFYIRSKVEAEGRAS